MTEEEKKTIEYLENSLKSTVTHKEQLNIIKNLIQKQQTELEKKNKIIDEMARWIFDKDYVENSLLISREDYYSNCIKQVKQYFEKKVEEE